MSSTALAILGLVAGALRAETQQGRCTSSQYDCADGSYCIPAEFKCDGMRECRDGSDEAEYTCRRCTPSDFMCSDGRGCIDSQKKCDGFENCHDGSDELEINCGNCTSDQFACADGKQCINKDNQCDDGYGFNCADYSDEVGSLCEKTCQSEEFACANGKQCIPAESKCDAKHDCFDRSDEELSLCGFQCAGDNDYWPKSWQCDGHLKCPDGSDEKRELCGFECVDGSKIIHKLYKCDGEPDCPDGSDEQLCERSCAFSFTTCAFLLDHDDGGSFDFENTWQGTIYDQCKDQCCRDENCKSFDYREDAGPNCRISYVTKDEVPDSFISTLDPEYNRCESGSWTYNEIATEEIVGDGDECGERTLKRCGPGLYCDRWNYCVPKWEF